MGSNILGIEGEVSWATPGSWTERNFPCNEDGANCTPQNGFYKDPSLDIQAVYRRL